MVSVHDLIWLHDARTLTRLARTSARIVYSPSIRAADRIITGSRHAALDIERTLGIAPERIAVIPHGPGEPRHEPRTPEKVVRERLGLGRGPLVLAVGPRRRHKNLTRLVEGFALLDDPSASLVLAGIPSDDGDAELRAASRRTGVADRTVILDWVDASDLEGLFAAGSCLALPSLDEGFGFTTVEAMARGVPVVCSSSGGVAETAAGAALLFDPREPASIAAALGTVLRDADVRSGLIARGLERARALSWHASAVETLRVYDEAIAARAR